MPNAVKLLLKHRVIRSFLFSPCVKEAKMGNKEIGSMATKINTKFSKKRFNIF